MLLLYTFMPSHSFLNVAFAFENMSEGWPGRWRFVWMPFCYRQSQENPEWAPGREKFAKTLAEAGGSNLFGHYVICAWELLKEQEKGKKAQGTLGWANVLFTLIYLNILTPLNYETDSFKQNTDCAGGDAQSLGWCHILDTFTTCLLEEKANAFIPQNRKATNLELTELRSYVWIVQRWVITD